MDPVSVSLVAQIKRWDMPSPPLRGAWTSKYPWLFSVGSPSRGQRRTAGSVVQTAVLGRTFGGAQLLPGGPLRIHLSQRNTVVPVFCLHVCSVGGAALSPWLGACCVSRVPEQACLPTLSRVASVERRKEWRACGARTGEQEDERTRERGAQVFPARRRPLSRDAWPGIT